MKNLKILLLLILFSSVSNAYTLYRGKCVDYYYFTNTNFVYYQKYSDVQASAYRSELLSTFDLTQFDTENNYDVIATICLPTTNTLGMNQTQFYFLMGLSGLIFSSIVFYVIANFLVGL